MTDTGDRTHIEGNASAGSDFVGRDSSTGRDAVGNQVHIELMERVAAVSQKELDEIERLAARIGTLALAVDGVTREVSTISEALLGDKYALDPSGLIQQVRQLSDEGRKREQQQAATRWLIIVLIGMIIVLVVMEIFQWIAIGQLYQLLSA